MARRRRNEGDWIFDVARLVGVLFLLGFVHPGFREKTLAFARALPWLLGGAFALGIGALLVWRFVFKPKQLPPFSPQTIQSLSEVPKEQPRAVQQEPKRDLGEQLRALDWFQFEKVVEVLYRQLGYCVTRRGGANPDGGIDLVIGKDGEQKAIQCKQWKTWNVGVKAIREFLGALTDAGIPKGIFITLCGYTGDAKQLAEKHGIEIVNETDLVRMLEGSDARYNPELIAALQDTRKFCPKCESEMVLRTATKGIGAGRQFWGCSTYPRCRFKMQV